MQQIFVFMILSATFALFLWGRIRYDLVALIALFAVVLSRVIPPEAAFSGFAHPAVITVAAVMIISQGLQRSGLIDLLARWMLGIGKNLTLMILSLTLLTAVASAFMNNVGALAIMMPIAIQLANKAGHSPSRILMPLAFASLLGGMSTLIGTPPNIIIATFRSDFGLPPFGMFDFSHVGLPVTLVGLVFIGILGWRLLPVRQDSKNSDSTFNIEDYITEVVVTEDSKLPGVTIRKLMEGKAYDLTIIGLIRNQRRIHIPNPDEELKVDDILIIEADSESLKSFLDVSKAELVSGKKFREDAPGSKDISIREVVVMQDSRLIGRTAAEFQLRSRFGINVLAIARGGRKFTKRLSESKFRAGDVLLIQGRTEQLGDVIARLDCLPLRERVYKIGDESRILLSVGIFGAAIAAVILKLLPVQIAFSIAALLLVLSRVISFREVYHGIDWPVIILLAAMIPVGSAFEISGGADTLAGLLLGLENALPSWAVLAVLMVITMLLSNVINNAATAVLMAPVAIHLAEGLGSPLDPYLMAVAIAASSAFLTPVGHQSNTLVMGPGGYKFSDYWKMGLPLQILVLLVSIPLLIRIWGG